MVQHTAPSTFHRSQIHYPMAFAPVALTPWPVLAQLLKLAILYQVCVDSISIVFSCDTAKDAVFNGLALKFVVELDKTLWNTVAHLDRLEDFSSSPFYSRSDRVTEKTASLLSVHWLLKLCKYLLGSLLTFVCLASMYLRQVAIVLHALETDTLPVSRDICTLWRWKEHKDQYMHVCATVYRWIITWIPLFAVDDKRWEYIESVCNGDDHERLRLQGLVQVFSARHFQILMYFSITLASCALAPNILRFILDLGPDKIQQIDVPCDPTEQRINQMEEMLAETQDRIEAVRLQMQEMRH